MSRFSLFVDSQLPSHDSFSSSLSSSLWPRNPKSQTTRLPSQILRMGDTVLMRPTLLRTDD